jgi:hypothetical protein
LYLEKSPSVSAAALYLLYDILTYLFVELSTVITDSQSRVVLDTLPIWISRYAFNLRYDFFIYESFIL